MGSRSLWTSIKRLLGRPEPPPDPTPQTTTYASGTGLVEITAPAVPGRPPSEAMEAHHQFITSN
jgi:hypothetical protein